MKAEIFPSDQTQNLSNETFHAKHKVVEGAKNH